MVSNQRLVKVKESREVKELRGKILGMEMELSILSKDLRRFKNELHHNIELYEAIQDNLNFLKTSNAAVSLLEYKKIKQQENLIIMRIGFYKNKVQPLKQVLFKKKGSHKEEMKKFEEVYKMQFKNNILEFPCDRRKEA